MRQYLFFFLFLFFSKALISQEINSLDIVKAYYNALNEADFSKVQPLVSATVTIIEGDNVVPYSSASFYDFFQWDSVFTPNYTILETSGMANSVFITVSVESERLIFLKNSPMVSKMKFTLHGSEIYMIEVVEYLGVDFDVWLYQRDNLVKWIDDNHKELSGFINDLTKKGAENYMKAIKFWNEH